ncbi:9514_t:CDS:2 [Funneliformis geosporum]|uniref:9514_t:CDS:1 n=1 Tax=Funneliformis geosporum TaxID=1117311 RepID=A0A9W4T0X3_9GLOM|nr:9514_t:CDS:2 [Funneliformis geosporum]
MAMGFDVFSSILCLYGGAVAGLMGVASSERMKEHFGSVAGKVEGGVNYDGFSGFISPKFNRTRKKVLAVAGFFFLGAIFAQIPCFARVLKLDTVAKNTPEWISNDYEGENKYQNVGNLEEMPIGKKEPNMQKN